MLLASAVPPWNRPVLHWVAFVPLLVALRGRRTWEAAATGWVTGFLAQAVVLWWLILPLMALLELGPQGAGLGVVAYLLLASWSYGAMLAPIPWLWRVLPGAWPLPWAVWCVALEYFDSLVDPIPYTQGVSQYTHLALWQVASVAGVGGLTALLLLVNGVVATVAVVHGSVGERIRLGFFALALLGLLLAWGHWRIDHVDRQLGNGRTLNILQVQSDRTIAWRNKQSPGALLAHWRQLTEQADPTGIDLVVWPEGALSADWDRPLFLAAVWDISDRMGADMLVGTASMRSGRQRTFNAVLHFARPSVDRVLSWEPNQVARVLEATGCDSPSTDRLTVFELRAAKSHMAPDNPCINDIEAAIRRSIDRWGPTDQALERMLPHLSQRAYATARAHLEEIGSASFLELDDGDFWSISGENLLSSPLHVHCHDDLCNVIAPVRRYEKMVPMPFGEAVPTWMEPWIRLRYPSLVPGEHPVVFELEPQLRIATPICYEGVLERACRAFHEPDILVNLTNDGWLGTPAATELHGMLVSARSVELGVTTIRAAHSGVSFVVDPVGRSRARTAPFEAVSRQVIVSAERIPTLYEKLGPMAATWIMLLVGSLPFSVRSRDARR